jgi:NDP-sugar pyrophosphorylase family protein
MIAMLLAAGRGERMQPLTRSLAKPAIPLLGTSMVAHGLHALAVGGAREAVVNLHHRPEDVVRAIGDGSACGLDRVHFSRETGALMGTGGGLLHAAAWLRGAGTIVIRNGDFLADIDAASALAAHRASGLDATMVLTASVPGYTAVPVSEDGRVIGFGPLRDVRDTEVAGRYTFTGLHFFEDRLLDELPDGPSNLVPALYARLASERRIGVFVHHGFWWEFGTPEHYREGVLRLLSLPDGERAAVLRHDEVRTVASVPIAVGRGARWRDGVVWSEGAAIGARCELGRDARVLASVLLDDVVVGDRAVLDRCVVGPGVHIPRSARFTDALVCTDDRGVEPLAPGVARVDGLLVRPIGADR